VATFWVVILVSGVLFYYWRSGQNRKAEVQRRQKEEQFKKSTSRTTTSSKTKPKKGTSGNSTMAKRGSSTSRLKSTGSVPTYRGPSFAQPGAKGDLFGYASFTSRNQIDAPFSLIDFETSGFQPGSARILEVAVTKIDSEGKVLEEYSTLINPGDGNVGRSDIHRITSGMIKNAPRISEVVGDLIRILDSSIVVAHNARFEEKFLQSAFREAGISHPVIPTIDTLWLSRQVLRLPNYKLGTIISEFGYDFKDAHTALGDVRAMSKILPQMLSRATNLKYPTALNKPPACRPTGKTLPRSP